MEKYRENIHHQFWEARKWRETKLNKLIRQHSFSKHLMLQSIHNDLHRHVDPIEPPTTREDSEIIYRLIKSTPTYYTTLDASKMLSDELYAVLPEYSDHLYRQIPFLELSRDAMKRRHIK